MFDETQYSSLKSMGNIVSAAALNGVITVVYKTFDPMSGAETNAIWTDTVDQLTAEISVMQKGLTSMQALLSDASV